MGGGLRHMDPVGLKPGAPAEACGPVKPTGRAALGGTDRLAAEVTEGAVSPRNRTAAVFHLMGVVPCATVRDGQGRPFALSEGSPIKELVG